METAIGIKSYKSSHELDVQKELVNALLDSPIPKDQLLENLGLFLTSKNFARIQFMHHMYKQIVDVPGAVLDFGTRWGQNLALFSICRGMYEPFNRHRKLVGFDTFSGFPSVDAKDGKSDLMKKGNVTVSERYEDFLDKIMNLHELENPISHIKKYELRKGDASIELERFLKENTHTIVALAYFDFDLYEPTKVCLNLLKDRLVKGTVIGFDELNDPDSPGETLAVMETLGLRNIKLRRLPHVSRATYCVIE